MKTKRVVAVMVGTALVATTAFTLAGCGAKKANLNISDYAVEYSEEHKINAGYSSLVELTSYKRGYTLSDGLLLIYDDSSLTASTVYSIYSTKYEKSIVTGLTSMPDTFRFNSYGTGVRVVLDNGTFDLYAPDGTVIMKGVGSISSYIQSISAYVKDAKEPSNIMVVTGTDNTEEAKDVKRYIEVKKDKESNLYSYTVINASDIKYYSSEFNKDEYYSGLLHNIYESTEDQPVEGDLLDYSVSYIGNTITFYQNNDKIGSVDVTNARGVGYAGTNFYYSVEIPVDSNEKSKYNYTEISDVGIQTRYNCTLYKYDIAKNKTTEVKYDGRVDYVVPYYNYTNKTYDAAVVLGNKFVDGVAYEELSEFAYITDTNLNVAYDITDIAISSSQQGNVSQIYKLNDNYYLLGNFIVDNNLNVVSRAGIVYAEGLVAFSNNGYYGLKDLSGKIIAEPKYSMPAFYGNNALVEELQGDGTTKKVILSTDGTTKELTLAENETLRDCGGYYVIDNYTAGTLTTIAKHTYTVYNYAGTVIRTFADNDTVIYTLDYSGDKLTVRTSNVLDSSSLVTLYKLV